MKPIHIFAGAALGFVLALAVFTPPARADSRPAELPLFQLLNGEVSRDLNLGEGSFPLADAGGLTIVTYDAGIGCNTLFTGKVYEMHCDSPVHVCMWGDGGCSAVIGSPNYGRPVNASTPAAPAPFYFVLQGGTQGARKLVCITPATGDPSAICAPFKMQ